MHVNASELTPSLLPEVPTKVAVCMIGVARTFYLRPVYESYQREVVESLGKTGPVDTFLLMATAVAHMPHRMHTHSNNEVTCYDALFEGEWQRLLKIVQPVHVDLLKHSNCDTYESFQRPYPEQARMVGPCCRSGDETETRFLQMAMMDQCMKTAERHAEANGFSYTHFIRARPDMAYWSPIPSTILRRKSSLTSIIKADSAASDMFYVIPKALKAAWWDKMHRRCEDFPPGKEPVGVFFRGRVPVVMDADIRGGIVRHPGALDCWYERPAKHTGKLSTAGGCLVKSVPGLQQVNESLCQKAGVLRPAGRADATRAQLAHNTFVSQLHDYQEAKTAGRDRPKNRKY